MEAQNGLFSAYLGSVSDLPLDLFRDQENLYLGVQVDTDQEMERMRIGSIPFAAYAEYTGAQTLEGLSCAAGQVAKESGNAWVCADDDDILSGLSCASGQIPKWNGSGWDCGDDLGVVTASNEFTVSMGPGNCGSGCTETLDLGTWTFCALTAYEFEIYDNHSEHHHDRGRCRLDKTDTDQWQLTGYYFSADDAYFVAGRAVCGARCF
jgi:hypothetical protein